MNINDLASKCHKDAKEMGWYDGYVKTDVEVMMLVVTEVAEVVEELRKHDAQEYYLKGDKPEGYGTEVADTIIRLLDWCAYKNIDIQAIIDAKLTYNKTRGFKHGKVL